MKNDYHRLLIEKFGDPIGSFAGEPLTGVRDEREDTCPDCGMMIVDGRCGCEDFVDDEFADFEEDTALCPGCGMMSVGGGCGCGDSCPHCSQMPVGGGCGCGGQNPMNVQQQMIGLKEADDTCDECGMNEDVCECDMREDKKACDECGMNEKVCECGMNEGKKKKKGPTKKTAQKILKGTKTFAQKMKKVSGWADDPGAAAAWMMHKATGKWPSSS
jgi:hypothetical protein